MSMVNCVPSKLLSNIHYRLPHLSHVRFGGNFTEGSLSEILPGEIVHIGGWAGILLTVSLLLMVCFYVLCCCMCVHCKKGKCTACQTRTAIQQLLRYTSVALAILSLLLVLLSFWPEARIHDGINSSSYDVRKLVPEIAKDVLDSALLSIEQQRHGLMIGYLVSLLLFMIVVIFIIFFAQRCTCGTGVFVVMIVLAVAATTVHIPLVVFLFAVLVIYADVCVSIYSLENGSLCTNVQLNISSPSFINPDSLNVFCNQTVYHGFILIMLILSLAVLFILIQLFGFCYGSMLCCTNSHKYCEDDHELEETGTNLQLQEMPVTSISTTANISSVILWTPQKNFFGLKPVDRASNEWLHVKGRVTRTLKNASIIGIQQIHNMWLWDAYTQSKLRLNTKNKGAINERLLFHGSRQTRPEKIYKSEKGFDFRFANQGLWGEGAYFAVNALYSDGYAYVLSGGRRQFFLALVLTGESLTCDEDRSLKKPPLKDSDLTGNNMMFADERYDSVRGKTRGSDVYVVYEHDKAYPAYLITYRLQ